MKKYILIAIQEAKKSKLQHQHGAVIIYKGVIIGKGYNMYRKSGNRFTIEKKGMNTRSKHAESMAIFDARKKGYNCKKILTNCTMIVVRIKDNTTETLTGCKNSAPCKYCNKMLKNWKVGRVFHS
jgi:tRNA(Arg) A34 adenosine deaminase TadA